MPTPTPKYGTTTPADDTSAGGTGAQNEQLDYEKLYRESQVELAKKDKSYVGLQQTLQTKDESLKTVQQQLEALTTEHSTTAKTLEQLAKEKETLASTLDEKEIELASAQTVAARSKMILGEFPELSAFEAKGLLPQTGPDDNEEAMRKLFGEFKQTFMALSGKKADDFISGGFPKTVPDSSLTSISGSPVSSKATEAAQYFAAAREASLKGDQKAANAAMDKYYALGGGKEINFAK